MFITRILSARRAKLARLAIVGAVLFGAAPFAVAELAAEAAYTASPADGTWQMAIKADTATKNLGRDDFYEYVTIDGMGYTGSEMARLGFPPNTPTLGINALGETTFTVTSTSGAHGTIVSSGRFNLLYTAFSGTLTWTKDGQTYKYTYTGARYTPPVVEE